MAYVLHNQQGRERGVYAAYRAFVSKQPRHREADILQTAEMSQLLVELDSLREHLIWLQGQPKQVKRLAWEGRLTLQQADTVLAECIGLAARIEGQLEELAKHMDATAATQRHATSPVLLRLLPRITSAPARRHSQSG